MAQVVTWTTVTGGRISLCSSCSDATDRQPGHGRLVSVSHGRHWGACQGISCDTRSAAEVLADAGCQTREVGGVLQARACIEDRWSRVGTTLAEAREWISDAI